MTDKTELKPCRCGGKPEERSDGLRSKMMHEVSCDTCLCGTYLRATKDEARGAWNVLQGSAVQEAAPDLTGTAKGSQSKLKRACDDPEGWCANCGCGHDRAGLAHLPTCDAARAVTPAPAVPEGWRPMETAPKDGTEVLIYAGAVFTARWTKGYDNIRQEHWECFVTDALDELKGATNWMPLPAAPSSREAL